MGDPTFLLMSTANKPKSARNEPESTFTDDVSPLTFKSSAYSLFNLL